MTTSIRRRRLMLVALVMALAILPGLLTTGYPAGAQVDTSTTTAPTTTTTTLPPTTTTTRRRPPPTTATTTTTTTTLPPTTTTVATTTTTVATTTTTRQPPPSTTTFVPPPTTAAFVPPPSQDPPDDDESGGGLPGWSLPFLGAGAMLAAIGVATGILRFFTRGIPAIGRAFSSASYKAQNRWATRGDDPSPTPTQFSASQPTVGSRLGGFLLLLTSPFRRLFGRRERSARRMRIHSQATPGGIWDRILLRMRMTRARFTRTRSSVEGQRRYWWLRFRRFIPWLR